MCSLGCDGCRLCVFRQEGAPSQSSRATLFRAEVSHGADYGMSPDFFAGLPARDTRSAVTKVGIDR
ncbi:conserved hypothetical protein [Streptomyces pristinaespiralis ATCC 25486]|jgi:hypothetical protein|uniref:Uncharacterized protein n=1 Tax=Streptomyces pristinaespiralis (strain ATCC 25486 / DSM 40338 / CBS 914.69 / JCM 4507 / KCC S-0507 / NBRC 13074 / NRRL 2958 / 5647) TaxID=457429 RepID=D6X9X2_STRE2|nr:conserved hypothetical protein [Streptomyces pristinaespiralis ATCC 25486]